MRKAAAMHARAVETARLLLILCRIFTRGEASAGQLAEELDLGLSALSQHLSRMRTEGLLGQRRHGRQLFYRISESASGQLPRLLASICSEVPLPTRETGDDPMKPITMLAAVLGLSVAASAGVCAADDFWQTPDDPGRRQDACAAAGGLPA